MSGSLITLTQGVRPALSLKNETLVYGGTGTVNDPYIAATER